MQLTSYDFRGLISRRFLDNFLPIPASCRFQLAQQLPNFTLSDASGNAHQLTDYRGQPIVLAFTRIFSAKQYCPLCYPHILALRTAHQQFIGLGAKLLLITSTPASQSQIIQRELALEMPLLVDPSCQSFRLYGTGQALGAPLPAQFVLDAEGKLRFQHLFSFAHTNATPERLLWAIRNL
ncbi:MAG: AhpC/TSA family protein [Phormidesmis sp. RL_2_1]|nr:AhpC/TSA family protein [Phormidesmis sp. RL_2_1]